MFFLYKEFFEVQTSLHGTEVVGPNSAMATDGGPTHASRNSSVFVQIEPVVLDSKVSTCQLSHRHWSTFSGIGGEKKEKGRRTIDFMDITHFARVCGTTVEIASVTYQM